MIEKIKKFLSVKDKTLYKKIDTLELEIDSLRELITENYWKLKKEIKKPPTRRKKGV